MKREKMHGRREGVRTFEIELPLTRAYGDLSPQGRGEDAARLRSMSE